MRHSITEAMDLLVASRGANEAYPELDKVCAYVHWIREHARFLETSRDYIKTQKAEITARVTRAREEFRERHALLREQILWDWCPIWRILIRRPGIFDKLPSLPWKHDSKYLSSAAIKVSVLSILVFRMSLTLSLCGVQSTNHD